MYTILTTCPPYGSQNVGDLLIEQRTRQLIGREKGPCEFLTLFREEPLDPYLRDINRCQAVLLPGFPVRDRPIHPNVYRLVEDLDRIEPPLIPIGANWNVYPGDAQSRQHARYSAQTVEFLHRVASRVDDVSCREYFTADILERHGVNNVLMTGDPAWFDLAYLGQRMRRPSTVRRLAFSPPLSPFYLEQAKHMMSMLQKRFPNAERICAFHLFDADTMSKHDSRHENSAAATDAVTEKNRAIRRHAANSGFDVRELAGKIENLDLYEHCDLHVGYECHAHLNAFSRRRPSVLIAEDARGVGFNDTLGVGGFDGFVRDRQHDDHPAKTVTSGYCTTPEERHTAPPREDLHEEVEEFLTHEVESRFRRYIGLDNRLDDIYQTRMRPFIQALP